MNTMPISFNPTYVKIVRNPITKRIGQVSLCAYIDDRGELLLTENSLDRLTSEVVAIVREEVARNTRGKK